MNLCTQFPFFLFGIKDVHPQLLLDKSFHLQLLSFSSSIAIRSLGAFKAFGKSSSISLRSFNFFPNSSDSEVQRGFQTGSTKSIGCESFQSFPNISCCFHLFYPFKWSTPLACHLPSVCDREEHRISLAKRSLLLQIQFSFFSFQIRI